MIILLKGGVDNECVMCETNTDCIHIMGDKLACNPNLGCKKCYQSFGCPEGLFCILIKYLILPGDDENEVCVACLKDDNCQSNQICSTKKNKCVECETNDDCSSGLCNPDDNTCY